MSNQERLNYKETLCAEIQNYAGFTTYEKQVGKNLIESEVDESNILEKLIQKFETMSLNIRPFIEERGLARA